MTTPEVRKLIGKEVEWDTDSMLARDGVRRGTVEDVKARNVMIDGNWQWLPQLNRQGLRPSTRKV